MTKQRRVVFARINRRNNTLGMRPFAVDMRALAESRQTTFVVPATPERPARAWYAADMRLAMGDDFMTGILGYSVVDQKRYFDLGSWSWIKGATEDSDAASQDTVVPFAVDLREHNRWVAFATTQRIQPASFRPALGEVLSAAAQNLGLLPADWECDPVVSQHTVQEWIEQHPNVKLLRRIVKFSNPGRDLDEVRAKMREMKARRATEEYAAYHSQILDVEADAFWGKLQGLETGDARVQMESREAQGVDAKFDSDTKTDETRIDDYGKDLERGMDLVLQALVVYAGTRPQGRAT
ncbi:hypothetical protein AB0J86_13025 [Micromonospora sp. NPDC049559]|uniref:hypothetical protein n=1 Tax=Micromonospora sp. NPDC049559 TaxID=3155923 RepID=UPI0034303AFA